MPEAFPFFLAWLITWSVLFLYLWRLERKVEALQGGQEAMSSSVEEGKAED